MSLLRSQFMHNEMGTESNHNLSSNLLEKYSISVPRYTSYPTAPEWSEKFSVSDWQVACNQGNKSKAPISLYFHLPFCENQCYFCACNIVISKKREVTVPYLRYLKQEIENTAKSLDKDRLVEQIHLGGGTPTYFEPEQLEDLFDTIRKNFVLSESCEIGVEVDPRVTTYEHMEMLSKLGFNRISMGVQDFNTNVQQSINRVQPFVDTREIFDYARELGFLSINVDLIYGLPYQTRETFIDTIKNILRLDPDRIALFHYAHLPQMIPHQDKYIDDKTLPSSEEKIKIFQYAVESLMNNGFAYIGLDHFAKPTDELSLSKESHSLHRNFQGYTTKAGCDLFGFGITSISNIQNTYSQNIKKLNPYYEKIEKNEPPVFRGLVLSREDVIRKDIIMNLLCDGILFKKDIEEKFGIEFNSMFDEELKMLILLGNDNLVDLKQDVIIVTPLGQFFLRNIACVFDSYFQSKTGKKIFSKSI